MPALTLKQARDLLWSQASRAIQATASAADKLEVDGLLNQVQERYLTMGKPRGTVVSAQFVVYDQQVTLPRNMETVLGWKTISGTTWASWGGTRNIYNRWFQYTNMQLPEYWTGCNPGLDDRGDGFVTFRDLPSAGQVKIITTTTETASTFQVRGLVSGQPLYSGSGTGRYEGENLTLPTVSGNSVTSVATFDAGTSLYEIFKPASNGVLLFYHTASGTDTLIGRYAPGETLPNYRRYTYPQANLDNTDVIEVIAKRAFVPAVADNDFMVPSNIGAVKMGLMALNYEVANDRERADEYWNAGLVLLENERQELDGDSAVGVLNYIGDYGCGSIVNTM